MRSLPIAAVILSLMISPHLQAQRCADQAYKQLLLQKNPNRENNSEFEQWIKNKLEIVKSKPPKAQRTQSGTYTIPVVFHIIHNNEPIGTGTNISDAQVISQINVLNKDFKRLNSDASSTPAIFQSVAGAIDIEFVLAKQDPEGLATNGITRTMGTKTGWTLADNAIFKSLSYWPAEDYLNIWVINFIDDYIGYAQFPVSTLPGLENSSDDALTDGVSLHYRDVGSIDDGPFDLENNFNKGRTCTHEVGHFFGLRHIWGDVNGCSGTDYVDDTPNQSGSTNGCPSHPQSSCSTTKMFQNYMDYTNDACMNLYTLGQVARMDVVLQNSPRRASLTTSIGATAPIPVANDLGIKENVNPQITSCGGSIVPSVRVRNYGSNPITSAQITLRVGGVPMETKNFSLNLAILEETDLSFANINLTAPSTTHIEFEIIQTNGGTDGKSNNNLLSYLTVIPEHDVVPFTEVFNVIPPKWTIQNPDGQKTWEIRTAPKDSPSNKAIYISLYDYENEGTQDRLVTPVLDFSSVTNAVFQFDRAYAKFPNYDEDRLRIIATTNCSSNLSEGIELFNKAGNNLATTSNTSASFVPAGASQWSTESISLNTFVGQPNVQLSFVIQNGHGNNLYLDNVFILTGEFNDAALVNINSPAPVINKANPSPRLQIKNLGSVDLNKITTQASVNGGSAITQVFTSLQLTTGEETELILNPIQLNEGVNQVSFQLINPNDETDDTPGNNSRSLNIVVNNKLESIPTRQGFENNFFDNWISITQNTFDWEITNTTKGQSLVYRAFDNPSVGDEAWLVSPVLNFTKATEASLFFDLSYGLSNMGTDRLIILSSTDGGETYSETQYDQPGNLMSITNSNSSWIPLTDTDWKREYVNLNDLIGLSNVRLAFVAVNDNGNNIYLDNIELYNDDDPNPPTIAADYSIYTNDSEIKITFNLPSKEPVRLQIYNTVGQVIIDNTLPDTLNQTYTIDFSQQTTGIYIVRLQHGLTTSATRVFVAN